MSMREMSLQACGMANNIGGDGRGESGVPRRVSNLDDKDGEDQPRAGWFTSPRDRVGIGKGRHAEDELGHVMYHHHLHLCCHD